MTEQLNQILTSIKDQGGEPYFAGGYVRDQIMGRESKDIDIEVYKMTLEKLEKVLSGFGTVDITGKTFAVLKLHHLNVDFSIPRKDNKISRGHKGFNVEGAPNLSIIDACRRRDLTINSILQNPFTLEYIDPFDGIEDIKRKVLSATDENTFLEDPLRALRVMQFISRLDFIPDDELKNLCIQADLSQLPGERLYKEFEKLLLGEHPDKGLLWISPGYTNLIKFFPELNALWKCPQDPIHHAEGDVWTHTRLTVKEMKLLTNNIGLLFAALLHDIGKPSCTSEDGKYHAYGHEEAGVEPATKFLNRLCASNELKEFVCVMIESHMAPIGFYKKAKPAAYRRLARKLEKGKANLLQLEQLATADHFGRATEDSRLRRFVAGDDFLEKIKNLKVEIKAIPKVVTGKDLIARGIAPGVEMGKLLAKCLNVQEEKGYTTVKEILKEVL